MKRHKGITKLAPKKYRVRVRGTDPRTGAELEAKRIIKGTLAQALAIQLEMAEQLASDTPRQRPTLAEFADQWLAHRRATVKPSTLHKYTNDLRRHILPAMGALYLHSIRPRDVKAFIAEELRKSARWSVANRVRLLRTLAKDALAEGLTECDFCARVRLPRCPGYTPEAPNLLTAAQLAQLAEAIPRAWYPLFATLAFTGMRWGEVSALTWSDIDHAQGLIHIRRNNWKGIITTPKTTGSVRSVPMVPALADTLTQHRADMKASAHPGLTTGWIFPNARGGLHTGTPMGPVLARAARKAGLTMRITPHGLRRTFNDLARRVSTTQVVRSMMGHVTEAMTEHYSVVDAGEKQAVQTAIVDMIEGRREEKKSTQREEKREHWVSEPSEETEKPQ